MALDPRPPGPYETRIHAWLARVAADWPVVSAVDHDPVERRWYVRMRGEEKLVTTMWLTLGELTLQYETYFMPAPEENVATCFEYLLRVNRRLFAMGFSIGAEDAVYLTGQLPLSVLDGPDADEELDRVLGATYAYSEECFRTAMSLGYASTFRRRPA